MNPEQKKFIMGIIQKRMSAENTPRDPVKLLKDQAAERILAGSGSRADSSMVGFPVSTLSPSSDTKKKAVKKEEDAKKKIAKKEKDSKKELQNKIAELSIKNEDDVITSSEETLLESVPPDSIEAYKERLIKDKLDKLDIDSNKVKIDTKSTKLKDIQSTSGILDFLENNKRKSAVRRIINRADYRKAKDNPQLQASIMKEELAKKGYSEEEIIEIIKGL